MKTGIFGFFENNLRFLKLPRGWDIRISPRFLTYSPAFEIDIETSSYRLQTAKTMKDLLEVFELRYKVFLKDSEEESDKKLERDGYDLDRFDSICDHIIIREKETDEIVGTYRCISSLFSEEFYSETEFDLDQFLSIEGEKLELGRACIDRGHRNGTVIDLLWRGIAEYIKLTNTKFLFGCSSIKVTCPQTAKALLNELEEEGRYKDNFQVRPIGKFDMKLDQVELRELEPRESKRLIPPLLRSYFSAGSKVYGQPALDLDFQCVDFFTILEVDQLTPSYRRRYFR